MPSPAFAVSPIPAAVSAGAFVLAESASDPIAEVVVCAEPPVACGRRRCAVVVSAVPADVFARRAGALGPAAAAADRAVAGASVPARD